MSYKVPMVDDKYIDWIRIFADIKCTTERNTCLDIIKAVYDTGRVAGIQSQLGKCEDKYKKPVNNLSNFPQRAELNVVQASRTECAIAEINKRLAILEAKNTISTKDFFGSVQEQYERLEQLINDLEQTIPKKE